MRRVLGPALLLLVLGIGEAQAQETRSSRRVSPAEVWVRAGGRMMAPMGVGSVESILRRKDDLNLTEQQVADIEAIRRDEVARRQAEARELIDLQSRASAGLIDRTRFRDEMEKIEDAQRVAARGVRNRLEQILTEEQRSRLPFRFPIDGTYIVPRSGLNFDWLDSFGPSFRWDSERWNTEWLNRLRWNRGEIL